MKQRIKLLPRIIYSEIGISALSWILKSRKYGKTEEEHLTLSNSASLFLPFSVLPLNLEAFSHGCLHMAVALLRPTETSASVKVCKARMCLSLQSEEGLHLPPTDNGGVERAQCIPGQSLGGCWLESC